MLSNVFDTKRGSIKDFVENYHIYASQHHRFECLHSGPICILRSKFWVSNGAVVFPAGFVVGKLLPQKLMISVTGRSRSDVSQSFGRGWPHIFNVVFLL